MTQNNLIITGESGSGKTTLCERLAASARAHGWKTAGILTLPCIVAGAKTGMEAQDLTTSERRLLAARGGLRGPATETWQFDQNSLDWGAEVLHRALPTDLFIIDELGPLEFERGIGWAAGFDLLCGGEYRLAFVVVRPALVAVLQARIPVLQVVEITEANREARFEEIMALLRGLNDSR